MPDPSQPFEGDIAFAVSVATLYDLTIGRVAWPVRLTKHSHPTDATLTLTNRTPGGPILDLITIDVLGNPTVVLRLTEHGFEKGQVGGYLDFLYQAPGTPPAPAPGSNMLRVYSRGGQLYFKADGSGEQQIPVGEPPGPGMRWAFWMGGG